MMILVRCFFMLSLLFTSLTLAEDPPQVPKTEQNPFYVSEVEREAAVNEDHFVRDLMNMLASLALIIMVILIASWVMKRLMNTRLHQMNATCEIKILERRSLTPKTAIYMVEIGGKGMALAESSNGITLLTQFSPDKNFSQILEEKFKKDGLSTDQ